MENLKPLRPIPPMPELKDEEAFREWVEILKQRLRDKGQKVTDDPLNFKEKEWPRPLPYVWPTDRKGVVI